MLCRVSKKHVRPISLNSHQPREIEVALTLTIKLLVGAERLEPSRYCYFAYEPKS